MVAFLFSDDGAYVNMARRTSRQVGTTVDQDRLAILTYAPSTVVPT